MQQTRAPDPDYRIKVLRIADTGPFRGREVAITLERLNILIGGHGTGKTTILDAIARLGGYAYPNWPPPTGKIEAVLTERGSERVVQPSATGIGSNPLYKRMRAWSAERTWRQYGPRRLAARLDQRNEYERGMIDQAVSEACGEQCRIARSATHREDLVIATGNGPPRQATPRTLDTIEVLTATFEAAEAEVATFDHPERGLDITAMERCAEGLRKASERTQTVVATADGPLARMLAVPATSIILCRRDYDGIHVETWTAADWRRHARSGNGWERFDGVNCGPAAKSSRS